METYEATVRDVKIGAFFLFAFVLGVSFYAAIKVAPDVSPYAVYLYRLKCHLMSCQLKSEVSESYHLSEPYRYIPLGKDKRRHTMERVMEDVTFDYYELYKGYKAPGYKASGIFSEIWYSYVVNSETGARRPDYIRYEICQQEDEYTLKCVRNSPGAYKDGVTFKFSKDFQSLEVSLKETNKNIQIKAKRENPFHDLFMEIREYVKEKL